MLALHVRDDGVIDREVRDARMATADAALAALADESGREAEALRAELAAERQIAATANGGDGRPIFPAKVLRAKTLAVRRERLLALRSGGAISDEAFHRLEEELDLSDLAVAIRV